MLPLVATEFWIGAEPKFKYLDGSGQAVAQLRVKAVDRVRDGDDWKDGKTLWANANVWDKKAEHAYESLKQGDLVVITGKIYTREYEHKGERRTSVEIDVVEIGPSLRFRTMPHGAGKDGEGSATPPPAATASNAGAANTAAPSGDDQPAF